MSESPSGSSAEPQPSTSARVTRSTDQQLRHIELVGDVSHQITGGKLPSNRQMLQMLFYNTKYAKFDTREGARLTVDAAIIFWQQARIPTRDRHKLVDKLEKLHNLYQSIQKSLKKPTPHSKTNKFVSELDDLFDMAHANAMELMKIEEDKKFLLMQREKGRPGCMAGVDMALYAREKRSQERKKQENARKRKHAQQLSQQFRGE